MVQNRRAMLEALARHGSAGRRAYQDYENQVASREREASDRLAAQMFNANPQEVSDLQARVSGAAQPFREDAQAAQAAWADQEGFDRLAAAVPYREGQQHIDQSRTATALQNQIEDTQRSASQAQQDFQHQQTLQSMAEQRRQEEERTLEDAMFGPMSDLDNTHMEALITGRGEQLQGQEQIQTQIADLRSDPNLHRSTTKQRDLAALEQQLAQVEQMGGQEPSPQQYAPHMDVEPTRDTLSDVMERAQNAQNLDQMRAQGPQAPQGPQMPAFMQTPAEFQRQDGGPVADSGMSPSEMTASTLADIRSDVTPYQRAAAVELGVDPTMAAGLFGDADPEEVEAERNRFLTGHPEGEMGFAEETMEEDQVAREMELYQASQASGVPAEQLESLSGESKMSIPEVARTVTSDAWSFTNETFEQTVGEGGTWDDFMERLQDEDSEAYVEMDPREMALVRSYYEPMFPRGG